MNEKRNFPEQTAAPEPFFRCGACGCEELQVTRRFTRSKYVEATLPCDCGAEDVAAIHRYRLDTLFEQTGTLDDCHQYELDAPEEIEALGTEDEEYEVHCPGCAEGVDESCWEIDASQTEIEDTDDEFYVHCEGCGREVEFGWSHSDRGGRIWPAECADFNPWKCVPEPRYEEAWHLKGWLRPVEAQSIADYLGCPLDTVRQLIESGTIARHPKSKTVATDFFGLARYIKDSEEQAQSVAGPFHAGPTQNDPSGTTPINAPGCS